MGRKRDQVVVMRWSIIRLIWLRELRDQLRDRRTLFMVAVLPLLMYPVLGFAVIQFALGFGANINVIGIVGGPGTIRDFPPCQSAGVAPYLACLSATGLQTNQLLGAAAFLEAGRPRPYPLLISGGQFPAFDVNAPLGPGLNSQVKKLKLKWLDRIDPELLRDKTVDLFVAAPADFFARLEKSGALPGADRPTLELILRPDDDYSKQAKNRLQPLLESWKRELMKERLARKNLPANFTDPFEINEPQPAGPPAQAGGIFDMMVRIFPFMLVMWSLAGALYPAVDLCAGEKERGTMETLLITPAGREEIVLGKFLTIWVFSAGSALLNLLSMAFATWQFGAQLPQGALPVGALLWSVVLSLPLSALFSAISLAIGAYARSSKEGQYYLMPLFLITMPLIFLTLAPGVELNPFYSMVPVTGVALLMQKLMTAGSLAQVPWLYFIPVLVPIGLYSWLALRWAIEQFQREEVLFREAERIDFSLWVKSLFREKEETATAGQAFFCFGLILALRWLSVGLGQHLHLTMYTGITLLGFVAAPALLMAILFNTRPRAGIFLRWPNWREAGLAAVLAILLLPAMAAFTLAVFRHFPHLTQMVEDRQPIFQQIHAMYEAMEEPGNLWLFLFTFALLPALCEEIAFRGYILTGLRKRYRPRTAIVLCSFMFALFHMNVFQFLPAFFLGIVLGLLTVRSQSLVPAMMFHFLHNTALLRSPILLDNLERWLPDVLKNLWPIPVAASLGAALVLLWWLYRKPYVEMDRYWALKEKEKAGADRS